jgi:hypothetical protein
MFSKREWMLPISSKLSEPATENEKALAKDIYELKKAISTILREFNGKNVLDAFGEQGVWTPTGNGVTFSAATGSYTRIGNIVHARFNVVWPNTADGGNAQIKSLPFTIGGAGGDYGSGSLSQNTFGAALELQLANAVTYITVVDGATFAAKTNANLSLKQLIGSVLYTTT